MKHAAMTAMAAVFVVSSIVIPQKAAAQSPAFATMIVHKGRCSTFKFGEKELSCDKALYTHYPKDNRQSFAFELPDGMVGLSGAKTKIIPQSGYTLLVDAVTMLQGDGKDTKRQSGEGICTGLLSDDRQKLRAMRCEAKIGNRNISVHFSGNGDAGIILKSESILNGVEEFYDSYGYKEAGLEPAVRQVQNCYQKMNYRGDVEPLARCFAMHYAAYKVGEARSFLFNKPPDKFILRSNVLARAGESLRKFGYDNEGVERQIVAWESQVERWMTESGRQ